MKYTVIAIAVVAAVIAWRHVDESVATPRVTVPPAPVPIAAPRFTPAFAPTPIVAGGLRLEGQAIDAAQQPIAGATITLGGTRTAITEADGSFAFDGLAAGSYSLTGERGELYGEAADETLDDTSDPVTIEMRHGPTLVVRVVAATGGSPIAGATLRGRHDRITDRDGVATIRGLELGSTWLEVAAAGYAPQRLQIDVGELPDATIEQVVQLTSGASLAGIVVDEHARPVAHARVRVEAPGDVWRESVEADDDGRWRFEALGPGRHVLQASSELHLETADQVVELDGVTPRAGIVVHVETGGEVAGVVVDRRGAPVAGVTVRAGSGSADTDASGAFVVRGIDAGEQEVTAETATGGSQVVKVTVARGARVQARLVLEPSSLAGVVRDAHGLGVEGVFVTARETTTRRSAFARTDELGRFDVGGVAPGTYEIVVERDDEPAHEPRPLAVVTSPARGLALVLPDATRIVGRVVLDGQPVAHYGVAVTEDAGHPGAPQLVHARDGRFAREPVPPGTWAVVIAGPGFAKKVIEGVVVTAGTIDLGDIAVERGRSLTGRVVDTRGVPVAGASVGVTTRSGWRGDASVDAVMRGNRLTRTDGDGRYRLDGIELDRLRIQASHARGMSKEIEVPADATTLDLVIVGTGSIAGRIDHMVERQLLVRAESVLDDDDSYTGFVDAGGSFAIDRVPAGEYVVTVSGSNTLRPQHVVVRDGQATPIVFAMPERPLTLVVHSPECRIIYLEAPDQTSLGLEVCEHDRATFHNVAPGAYRVCLHPACVAVTVTSPRTEIELTPDP